MALPLTALSNGIATFGESIQCTPRERQVLAVLAGGTTSAANAARALGLSVETVNNHVKNLLKRAGVHSKSALLAALCDHTLTQQAAAEALLRPPRVLVAHASAEQFARGFAKYGLRAACAIDGQSPLQQARHERADVLVAGVDALLSGDRTEAAGAPSLWPTCIAVGDWQRSVGLRPAPFAIVPEDAATDDLVFTTLEACFQSPYERSRLLRVDADCPAVVEGRLWSRVRNFGFGGAFLELPYEHISDPAVVTLGQMLDVAFDVSEGLRLQAQAEVVWHRLDRRALLPCGIGVRFLHLSDAERRDLERCVRRSKLSLLSAGGLSRLRRKE